MHLIPSAVGTAGPIAASSRIETMMRAALVALGALVTSGCATVLGPRTYDVKVSSHPSGARVFVDGGFAATTPCVVQVPRGDTPAVSVSYKKQYRKCLIGRELKGGWVVVDLLFGILPLIVDAATGNWYGPDTRSCSVTFLTPRERPPRGYRARRRRRPRSEERDHEDLVKLCDAGVERYCAKLLERESEPEPEDCATSDTCREDGHCTARDSDLSTCFAATDDDCARSVVCREGGACEARDGVCVKPSRALDVRTSTTPKTRREVFNPGH